MEKETRVAGWITLPNNKRGKRSEILRNTKALDFLYRILNDDMDGLLDSGIVLFFKKDETVEGSFTKVTFIAEIDPKFIWWDEYISIDWIRFFISIIPYRSFNNLGVIHK